MRDGVGKTMVIGGVATLAAIVGVSILLSAPRNWYGDLPGWAMTATLGFAAAQYLAERERRARDHERRERDHAIRLQNWVETNDQENLRRRWVVVVTNLSEAPFHNITMHVRLHDELQQQPITLVVLPPGKYLIEYSRNKWELPAPYQSGTDLRPIMRNDGYRVEDATFTDSHGVKWSHSHHNGLVKVDDIVDVF